MNILLDYVFPVTAITPTAEASTAYLKQVLAVVKPKGGAVEDTVTLCTTAAQIAALTDNAEVEQLLDAGMSRVYVVAVDDLDLVGGVTSWASKINDFFTILISSDFTDAEITATQAQGVFTVSSYANLVSGTDDVVEVNGVSFTAQTGAATLGQATFQAATSNDATAASLAAQINAHASCAGVVIATVVGAIVTVKAVDSGADGNLITASYTDNDVNVGGAWTGLSGGTLAGGDGLFVGTFGGVIGIASTDDALNETRAVTANYCAFHTDSTNKSKNMFYAFGKLLSNALSWKNQQYIEMPLADDIDTLGEAENLFDLKISFVMDDTQFGTRLGLFAAGGEAIVAPYITKNLQIDLQSAALSYISGNQPAYTKTQATLLEDELQKVIDEDYIAPQLISAGEVEVLLEQENFVASGYINIAKPNALWRIEGELRQTL